MLRPSFLALLLVSLSASTQSFAEDCDGDAGYLLTASPPVARLGDPVDVCLSGPPNDTVLFMLSGGPGPVDTPVGSICLDVPLMLAYSTALPDTGQLCLPTYMHCVPALDGVTFYMQFVSFATDGSGRAGRSNLATVTGQDDDNGCNFCVKNTKGRMLRMRYTGHDCSASHHSQSASAVTCEGDPAFAPSVRVVVQDKPNLTDGHRRVYFDGIVGLDGIFDIDAHAIGRNRLKGETWILALDLNDQLLHRVGFHTSCSEPLHGYDQFGAFSLLAFVPE